MTHKRLHCLLIALFVLGTLASPLSSAEKKKEKDAYQFTHEYEVKRTPVKNQAKTGTCWSFATISYVEAELLRMGKPVVDLSEMFIVRNAYLDKARNYVQLHGTANFSSGGQSHDVMDQFRKVGAVPEAVYSGQMPGEAFHNHGELSRVLQGILDGVLKKNWGDKISQLWFKAFERVLDTYLGEYPASFQYEGKSYTPKTFLSDYMQFNPDDYVELTSFSHHPFYSQMRLEIPDNWSYNTQYYNLPLDDFMAVIEHALKNNFSVCWDGDVSEKDFSSRVTGYGIVPEKDWELRTVAEKEAKPTAPIAEKVVTQELRQGTFEDLSTTDDHLMHLVGLARDQKGTRFYLTKNSHGTDIKFDGYLYMSEAYVRLKTTAVMVHKDALPATIRTKMNR